MNAGAPSQSMRPPDRISAYVTQFAGASLADHRAAFRSPETARGSASDVVDAVERAGLRGRGGARFPTAVKLRAVAGGRGRPIVVANGSESEPASRKDAVLLASTPHLVLDGAALAAAAVDSDEVIVGIKASSGEARRAIIRAAQERQAIEPDGLHVQVVEVPDRYIAGEERSLTNLLNGGPAIPTSGPRPFERGVARRPTLLLNVETLANLAMIWRSGPEWFRSIGTTEDPGSMLVTISGTVARPGVYEVPLGSGLAGLIDRAGGTTSGLGPVLVGGYCGSWVAASDVPATTLDARGLAAVGGIVGPGIVVVTPEGACGWLETAGVMRWLSEQTAGQCGPCVHGLAAIAGAAGEVLAGSGGSKTIGRLERWASDVEGRGACRFPDGAVRLLRSALQVFGPDVRDHARGRACPGSRRPAVLPLPGLRRAG